MRDKPKIITSNVYPPIPNRQFDWSAVRDGYEPGALIGWGTTEAQAIEDLLAAEDDEEGFKNVRSVESYLVAE